MNIQAIGSIACDLLAKAQSAAQAQPAQVWGSSRRGVFLRLDCGWIIFLSNEPERGPLTLNVGPLLPPPNAGAASLRSNLGEVSDPSPKLLDLGRAVFWAGRGDFDLDGAQVWSAPPRPARVLPVEQRNEFIEQVVCQAQRIRHVPSLEALQVVRAGKGHGAASCSEEARRYILHLAQILAQPISQMDPSSLAGLLGLGSGLTPSGDDIVLGMLLALNRWGDVLAPGLDCPALNRSVLSQAYARTTTLSANLIECASRGEADERLVTALDGLLTGAPGVEACAVLLAGWGNSSGLDALCGMALVQ